MYAILQVMVLYLIVTTHLSRDVMQIELDSNKRIISWMEDREWSAGRRDNDRPYCSETCMRFRGIYEGAKKVFADFEHEKHILQQISPNSF